LNASFKANSGAFLAKIMNWFEMEKFYSYGFISQIWFLLSIFGLLRKNWPLGLYTEYFFVLQNIILRKNNILGKKLYWPRDNPEYSTPRVSTIPCTNNKHTSQRQHQTPKPKPQAHFIERPCVSWLI
jgi:hypothetical protein